ncbi:MAG: EutN/CcmL family microcompartment protein [Candidatus Latescibacterota bacterium]|nr:MAG: EutN/CcmL family microcompartment protein [Candidatus Latescibacterota bacterium]
MQIARVSGTLVSTLKHDAVRGHRMLIVQPCALDGSASGPQTMALDVVDAGPGDWVLLLDEGASASQVLENPRGPVRTLIVGVIDEVHVPNPPRSPSGRGNP